MNPRLILAPARSTASPGGSKASRTSARFWSAPALWRFGDEAQRSKSGSGLPLSKTLARFHTHADLLLPR
jgi:hypothetical protein